MVWCALGVIAVTSAFGVAATDEGMERLAQLTTPAANEPAVKQARADSPQMMSLQKNVARLQSELRRAALEKTAMAQRLASIEDQLTPATTGSIGRQPRRAEDPGQSAVSFDHANTAEAKPSVRVVYGELPDGKAVPAPAMSADNVRNALPRLSPSDPSVLMRTSFAIEVGHAGSMKDLRARWKEITTAHNEALAGFDPLVAVRETDKGQLVLRLLAGPMSNAADAIRLCMRIRDDGADCTPVSYEGQRLALQ
ncbi:MAG: hypothetical protein AB7O39_01600 [Flavobacteriaceae bacterium]